LIVAKQAINQTPAMLNAMSSLPFWEGHMLEMAAAHLTEVTYQSEVQKMLALLDAQNSALEGQMQKVGVWWGDALNFLVRPLVTYAMVLLYSCPR
jgi:sensor domain CHASE-containing protein